MSVILFDPLPSPPMRLADYGGVRSLIKEHLTSLSVTDRYLRFCSVLSDEAINGYVDRLDLSPSGKDVVYGVINTRGEIVGLLHIAPTQRGDSAEFALSVLESERKRGIGDKLFQRGLLYCALAKINHVYMNCLATNTAIKKMAQKRGMKITTDYSETVASLDLKNTSAVVAWLASTQADTIALYDINCMHARQAWDNYVAEIRKIVQPK